MSTWLGIEDAVVAACGVQVSGQAALATVKGATSRERKVMVASIGRERLPAAYVVVTGREAGEKSFRTPGEALLTVLYAIRSERADDEARRGGTGVVGAFAIAEAVAASLQGLNLGGSRQLLLIDERASGGEDGTALWEQRYEVRERSGPYWPSFAGLRLIGELSEVQVEVGNLSRAASSFAFPGVNGVFERFGGTRERPIIWRGQLRATSDGGLSEIEAGIDELIRQGLVQNVVDTTSRVFESCVLRRFSRKGPRRHDDVTGRVLQDFEIEFEQLAG